MLAPPRVARPAAASALLGETSTHPPPLRPASGSRAAPARWSSNPVNLFAIAALALSMSADAFAAALGKGALLDRPGLGEALRTGSVFGAVEGVTPVAGWALGVAASAYVAAIDHWIAFVLLTVIGGKMIWDSVRRPAGRERPKRHSLGVLLTTAIGTSIDAMAVGVTLAFLNAGIVVAALAIAAATFAMTTLGVLIGRVVGAKFGRIAEALGGLGLILIGAKILIGHGTAG